MVKHIKPIYQCLCFAILTGLVLTASFQVSAKEMPYYSYTYSYVKGYPEAVHSPAPFEPVQRVDSQVMGDRLSQPVDLFIDDRGVFYILDKGNNLILIVDDKWNVIKEISSFFNPETDQEDSFHAPEGICVDKDGDIYVADTQNNRVVILDKDGTYKKSFTTPKSKLFDDNYVFFPIKIAVDSVKRMYVISRNDFAGILYFNADTTFFGYMGSNRVTFNPIDMIWKKIMTEEQKNQSIQFVPVEYTNLCLDRAGFIYTVSASPSEATPVKLLNTSGDDVLLHAGYSPDISGDVSPDQLMRSTLIDICADDNGTYYVLDFKLGHIFAYNSEGFLLYAFGSLGEQIGTFTMPSAIGIRGNNLYVLDESTKCINIFTMTEYAEEIRKAEKLYNSGNYDESLNAWDQVSKMNGNFELAYAQIGKIQLMQGKYEDAMHNFKLGNVRGDSILQQNGYNKSFIEYRKQFLSKYLAQFIIAGFLLLILIFLLLRWRRFRKRQKGG